MKPICIVQNWSAESSGVLGEHLERENIPFSIVRNFDNEPLPESGDIEAAIVLGTPTSVRNYREHEYLKKLFSFMSELVRRDTPTLGICFGGQLLARILGAEVVRNEVKEIGIYGVKLTEAGQADPIFAGIDPDFEVFHWHADTFAIPFGGDLLATGETCRNQAYRKGNAIGIQFHIEPTVDEVPTWCDEYADELAEEGMTKEKIVSDYAERADRMREIAGKLMRNFVG